MHLFLECWITVPKSPVIFMYYNMIVNKSTEISHARIFGLSDYFHPRAETYCFLSNIQMAYRKNRDWLKNYNFQTNTKTFLPLQIRKWLNLFYILSDLTHIVFFQRIQMVSRKKRGSIWRLIIFKQILRPLLPLQIIRKWLLPLVTHFQ